ncbi:MAG: hypothetical protein U5L00_02730 [Desulfovermiculus sp.]|nr:hypothetical protein [Desulfovermiculus sp.]
MNEKISLSTVKYVHDEQGKCLEVIVPFTDWQALMSKLSELNEKQHILSSLSQACQEVKNQRIDQSPEDSLEEFLDEL